MDTNEFANHVERLERKTRLAMTAALASSLVAIGTASALVWIGRPKSSLRLKQGDLSLELSPEGVRLRRKEQATIEVLQADHGPEITLTNSAAPQRWISLHVGHGVVGPKLALADERVAGPTELEIRQWGTLGPVTILELTDATASRWLTVHNDEVTRHEPRP